MSMDFRSRSADVRREAADILWRFRSSRAARRAGTLSDGPDDPVPRPGLPVSPATEELIRSALSGPVDGTGAPDVPDTATPGDLQSAVNQSAVNDPLRESVRTLPAPIIPDVQALDRAVADPAWPPPSSDGHAPRDVDVPAGQVGSAQDESGAPHAAVEVPDDGSWQRRDARVDVTRTPAATALAVPQASDTAVAQDLTDLPGVGAGLVWLLGRCGVNTLADLAAADATRLEQELGLVGQLLDLPSWIDLARQAIATKGKSTS